MPRCYIHHCDPLVLLLEMSLPIRKDSVPTVPVFCANVIDEDDRQVDIDLHYDFSNFLAANVPPVPKNLI